MADPLLQRALAVVEWAEQAGLHTDTIVQLKQTVEGIACLLCRGKGFVTHGNDGGPCGRCEETGIDPRPEEAAEYREKWKR